MTNQSALAAAARLAGTTVPDPVAQDRVHHLAVVIELALTIADGAAEKIITSRCTPVPEAGQQWYMVPIERADEERAVIVAIEYLELRGRIERHAIWPGGVRIVEAPR